MPVGEEAAAELRHHQWLCDQTYEHLQKAKENLWKIEVERAARYGKTEPIAAKADQVMWGVRKQVDELIDIREKLEEEDPPEGGNMPAPRTETERKSFHERIFGKGSTPPLERLGRGQVVNDLMPMPPEEGPPLPRGLGVRWPWRK